MNACPKDAIRIFYEKSFFYEPTVDYDKCVFCKKCVNVCTALEYASSNKTNPKVYAAYAHDGERKGSSSGGVFPLIAQYILKNGGYVCGAAFDDDWNVRHIIIDRLEDLQKLRFSKYVQSYIGDVLQKIKQLLVDGKTVLFSGTPCQNAGLKKFLDKNYENLYTIDLLCHGVPSPKIWQDYLEKNFDKPDIKDVCFRSKEKGWVTCADCVSDTAASYVKTTVKKTIGIFYEAFLKHKISNESCMECKYKQIPRPGDFTLGDFWYYFKYDRKLNDGKGLSVVLANNRKAERFLSAIKDDFAFIKKIPIRKRWEYIEITNQSRASAERFLLFKNYGKYGVNRSIELALGKRFDVALLSFFNGMNYGSALVAYAQNKILEDMGYSVLNIHKGYNSFYPYDETNKAWQFAKRNYYISRYFERDESCRELNDIAETFIVGSDTQWWWNDVSLTKEHCWLDFVESSKRKISFSTSFANDTTDIPLETQKRLKYLYSRFDALSVREQSGVKILKEEFGFDSECLVVPTFVVDKQHYDELAGASKRTDTKYILAYILDLTEEKENFLKSVTEKQDLPLVLIPRMSYDGTSELVKEFKYEIEDFIYLVKNADYVITDSFHGVCFSVIFERNFMAFVNKARGLSRYEIFYQMKLQNHFFSEMDKLNPCLSMIETDWNFCRSYILKQREKSLAWLNTKLSLDKPTLDKEDLLYDYLLHETSIQDFIPRRIKKLGLKVLRYIKHHKIRVAVFLLVAMLFILLLIILIFVK